MLHWFDKPNDKTERSKNKNVTFCGLKLVLFKTGRICPQNRGTNIIRFPFLSWNHLLLNMSTFSCISCSGFDGWQQTGNDRRARRWWFGPETPANRKTHRTLCTNTVRFISSCSVKTSCKVKIVDAQQEQLCVCRASASSCSCMRQQNELRGN